MRSKHSKTGALVLSFSLAIVTFFFYSFIPDGGEWIVPDKYKNMENPTEANSGNLRIGKDLYSKHCKSCHGAEGLGDGPKAAGLDTYCGDFTSVEFKDQTDGELFYKTTFGRDEMPTFEKTIPDDEDRWLLIHYIKSLE